MCLKPNLPYLMTSTCPLTVVISPSMAEIKDVFPAPTWPTIIVSFPTGILTLISFRATSSSLFRCQENSPSDISNTFLASIVVRFSATSSSSSVDTPLVCRRRGGSFPSFTVRAKQKEKIPLTNYQNKRFCF